MNRRASRLHDEDLSSTHILIDLDVDLLVVELANGRRLEFHTQILANRLCKRAVATSGENTMNNNMDKRLQELLLVILQGLALVDVVLLGGFPFRIVLCSQYADGKATGSPLSANVFLVR